MNDLLEIVREKLKETIPYEWEKIYKIHKSEGGAYADVPADKSLNVMEYYKANGIKWMDIAHKVNAVFEIYTSTITLPDEEGFTNYGLIIPYEGEIEILKGKEVLSDFYSSEWNSILFEKYFNIPSSHKKIMEKYHKLYDENGNRKPQRKKSAPRLVLNEELEEWFDNFETKKNSVQQLLCGMQLMDRTQMEAEWKSWREFDGDEVLNDKSCFSSHPIGAIKRLYSNPKWIPIAHDGSGNYIGVDLNSDKLGENGQVINFGRDENDKYVFASSISEFVELLNNKKDSLVDEIHLIDQLKKMV